LTASTTCTVFVPDCRLTVRSTAGRPSTFELVSARAMPSSTRATSPRRIAWPPRRLTTMSWNPATDSTRPRVRSVSDVPPCSMRPPGISAFCVWSARETSVTVRLYARRRAASSRMLTCRDRPPTTATWPTPLIPSSCRRSVLSAYSVMSRIGSFAETAIVSTGA
jgi:hypothetical protein